MLLKWKSTTFEKEIEGIGFHTVRPKIKLSLFPQTRPTRENRPDSNNFFAIFSEELFFFRIFRYNRYWFVVLR